MALNGFVTCLISFGLLQVWAGANVDNNKGSELELSQVEDFEYTKIYQLGRLGVEIRFHNHFSPKELLEGSFVSGVYAKSETLEEFKWDSPSTWGDHVNTWPRRMKSKVISYCKVTPLFSGAAEDSFRLNVGTYKVYLSGVKPDGENNEFTVIAEKSRYEKIQIDCATPTLVKKMDLHKTRIEILIDSFGQEAQFLVETY